MTGHLVHVLRNTLGDCTNGGATSRHDSFVLVGEGIEGPFEPNERTPGLMLVRRWEGTDREYVHARPLNAGGHTMMGGNFVYSSDSRFREINRYPIPVHDRVE